MSMSRNRRLSLGGLVLVGLVVALSFALFRNRTQGDKDIYIGAAMPLTGDGASYGVPQKLAAELAVAEINKAGGVLGRHLQLVPEDDQAQPVQAANVARLLAADPRIVAVLGHPNSGNAMPASRIYHESGVPYIVTSATNPAITKQGFSNVFRFAPTDDMQGRSAADFAYDELHSRRLAVLHDNATYGEGLARNARDRFRERGGTVALFDAIQAGQANYRPVLRVVRDSRPDALFYGGMLPEAAVLLREARELGLDFPMIFGDGAFDTRLLSLSGTDGKGVYVSFLAPPWKDVKSSTAFFDAYKARYGEVPPFAPYGYDAVLVIAQAIRRAHSTNRGKILRALQDPSFRVNGATGPISFDHDGQTDRGRFYFYTFNESGAFVLAR